MGLLDDVLDLPWRIKIALPIMATIPLILNYQGFFSYLGSTIIKFPLDFGTIDIGYFYHLYILLLIGFLSNAINIYAGINGLEVG